MHDLQLDAVGIVEEDRVITQLVRVLLGAALDLRALPAEPLRPLVDHAARRRLEREVVEADPVAVVWLVRCAPGLTQADRAAGPREVPDRLALLALHLAVAVEAERREQLAGEGQAPLDRRDDEVDVVDAGGLHVPFAAFPASGGLPAQSRSPWSSSTTTS